MDLLYPCEVCGHHYEDHLIGLSCAICWADEACDMCSGGDCITICSKFVGDNLKYLEDKHNE